MVFVKKRRTFRKPKDILTLALKNLWPGEELLCTRRCYTNIAERLNEFANAHKDRRLATITWENIKKIRRVA
jgi:hypothetical protein